MVAAAAFLIILVIIFGLENVRNFIFGTFGVLAWVVIGFFGLAAIIMFGEWWHKIGLEQKKDAEKERKKKAEEKAKLKAENPKEYKSIRRFKAVTIGGLITFVVALAVLTVILIASHK